MAFSRLVVPTVLGHMLLPPGIAKFINSHPSFLGSVGSGVPSIVDAAKSLISFSRSYDFQLDKIINNSALQELVSPAMPRSPTLAPDFYMAISLRSFNNLCFTNNFLARNGLTS